MEKENLSKEQLLAKTIWKIPFASWNLEELTKQELLILINSILNWEFDEDCNECDELELEDFLFEQKCWLIKCLDKDFFKKRKNSKE